MTVGESRRWRGDAGAVAAHVAIVPVVMFLLFLVVQVCLWYYGRVVAYGAAQHGLEAARAWDGSAQLGEDYAQQFLDQTGGLQVTAIDVDRTATRVRVEIHADAPEVLPFIIDAPIHVVREADVERPPG